MHYSGTNENLTGEGGLYLIFYFIDLRKLYFLRYMWIEFLSLESISLLYITSTYSASRQELTMQGMPQKY